MRLIIICALALLGIGVGLGFGFSALGMSQNTPLAHALNALKAGDRAAFVQARQEAEDALKTGWKPGDDVCKVAPQDFEKRGEALLIEKLDHPDLFKLDEDQRFVYAVHVTGRYGATLAEGWQATHTQEGSGVSPGFAYVGTALRHRQECPAALAAQGVGQGFNMMAGETARADTLKSWQADRIARYGNDDAYQTAMRRAAAHLDSNGYTAEWPSPLEFEPPEHAPTTFSNVRNSL